MEKNKKKQNMFHNNIRAIRSFKDVPVLSNALYVFDIDDTILSMDKVDWYVEENAQKPKLLDKKNLNDLIMKVKEAKSNIILLTARNENLKAITRRQLEKAEFQNDLIDCSYFDHKKGKKLAEVVIEEYSHVDHVIFIDDLLPNLVDVQNSFADFGYELHLCLINHFLFQYISLDC